MDVAERFGMRVQYERLAPGVYGATDHTNRTILLATEDHDVFFHELAHAIHRTFEPKTGHGQETEAETIAQLVAATLARLYGRPADNFSWNYMPRHESPRYCEVATARCKEQCPKDCSEHIGTPLRENQRLYYTFIREGWNCSSSR